MCRSAVLVMTASMLLSWQAAGADRQALEQAAKKACLSGDPRTGVGILAGLYVDSNDITYLFNQGRCFEQNGLYDDAIARFREYLFKGRDRLSSADEAVAQAHIATCSSYLKSSQQPSNQKRPAPDPKAVERASVMVAGQPAGPKADEPASAVVAGQLPEAAEKPGRGLRIAGIVVSSVGAAALISGVALNWKVNTMSRSLEKPDSFDRDTDSSRKNYETLGWLSYSTGAVCLTGGVILHYLGLRAGQRSLPGVALAPHLSHDMAGAILTGTF